MAKEKTEERITVKTVAMVSYNMFVPNEGNGWKVKGKNHILLLQNEDGFKWGIQKATNIDELKNGITDCMTKIGKFWEQLVRALPLIDIVVFYVGSYGAEHAIKLAADHKLAPDKAIFVFCDCNITQKRRMIHEFGFSPSKIIICECGGHETMLRIYQEVLATGSISMKNAPR